MSLLLYFSRLSVYLYTYLQQLSLASLITNNYLVCNSKQSSLSLRQRQQSKGQIISTNTMSYNNSTLSVLRAIFIYCIIIFPTLVYGEYDVGEEQLARIPYRYASASFSRDGVLYSYGGATRNSSASTLFTSISFDQTDGQVIYSDVPQRHSPGAAYSEAVLLPDNNRVLLFGGRNLTDAFIADSSTLSATNKQNNNSSDAGSGLLRLYEYRFDTQNWTAIAVKTTNEDGILPRNRKDFTATLSLTNGKVYIHGGQAFQAEGITTPINDSWIFDPSTYLFTRLSSVLPPGQPSSELFGHSAVAL